MKALLVLLPFALISCAENPQDPKVIDRKMVGLQQKFDLLDTNGDGYLTKSEIIAGFDAIGVVNQSPETADKIIKFYDFNKDGKISLRETQSGAVSGADELLRQYQSGELN